MRTVLSSLLVLVGLASASTGTFSERAAAQNLQALPGGNGEVLGP